MIGERTMFPTRAVGKSGRYMCAAKRRLATLAKTNSHLVGCGEAGGNLVIWARGRPLLSMRLELEMKIFLRPLICVFCGC